MMKANTNIVPNKPQYAGSHLSTPTTDGLCPGPLKSRISTNPMKVIKICRRYFHWIIVLSVSFMNKLAFFLDMVF
jgi:hypothetical protein